MTHATSDRPRQCRYTGDSTGIFPSADRSVDAALVVNITEPGRSVVADTVDDDPNRASESRAPTPTVSSPATGPADRPWRSPWTWTAAIVVALGRWVEAADRSVFHVAPDEPGQLAMARWLGGGTRWNMFDHLTWHPGYALTLAPLAAVVDSGEALVRAALTMNALFAGLAAACLTVLVRRWTRLGPRAAAGVAGVVALAPSAIAASAYTWAESLITLMFLVTVVALQSFVDRRSMVSAVAAVAAAAFAMTVHGRSLPMLPVTAVIVVVVLLAGRRRSEAVAISGLAVALGLASMRFTEWVTNAVWDEPSDANTTEAVVSRLDAPSALIDSFVGQAWYQLVATVGMVGLGTGVVIGALARPTTPLRRTDAAVLLALTAPLVATSVTFMADRTRPDQLVYGRYVDAVVWPLTALGLAWTLGRLRPDRADVVDGVDVDVDGGPGRARTPRRPWLAVAVTPCILMCGVIVAFRHGDQLAGDVGLRMMVPGLLPYIGNGDGVPVLTITIIATMILGAVAIAATAVGHRRVPRSVLAAGAVVVICWAGVRVHDAQSEYLNAWAIGDDVAELDGLVPDGSDIGVVMQRDARFPTYVVQRQRFQVYQLFLPDREFVWERTPGRYATTYVVAPTRVAALTDAGGEIIWYDPVKPMALWQLPDR